MAEIPPGDLRIERYAQTDVFKRLRYDLDTYFRTIKTRKAAHTNEYIYADAIAGLVELEQRVRSLEEGLEKRLKRVEGRVTAFIVETQ